RSSAARDRTPLARRDRAPALITSPDIATAAVVSAHDALARHRHAARAHADAMLARLPHVHVAIDVHDVDADRSADVERVVVAMPVIRMADVQVMMGVQMVRMPTDHERGRDAPEVSG